MKRGVGVALAALAVAMLASSAAAQLGPSVRQWMYSHDVTVGEALQHFGKPFNDASMRAIGLDGLSQANRLGFIWVTCVQGFVQTEGSVERLGMTHDRLVTLLNQHLAQSLGFLPRCTPAVTAEGKGVALWVWLEVWTQGDSYPMAQYYDLTTELATPDPHSGIPRDYWHPFQEASLGVTSPSLLAGDVDATMAHFANDLLQAYLQGTGR